MEKPYAIISANTERPSASSHDLVNPLAEIEWIVTFTIQPHLDDLAVLRDEQRLVVVRPRECGWHTL